MLLPGLGTSGTFLLRLSWDTSAVKDRFVLGIRAEDDPCGTGANMHRGGSRVAAAREDVGHLSGLATRPAGAYQPVERAFFLERDAARHKSPTRDRVLTRRERRERTRSACTVRHGSALSMVG